MPKVAGRRTSRGRVDKLWHFCEKLQEQQGVPFSDPAEMLAYVFFTGHDPLECVINKELGDKSPFAENRRTWQREDGGFAVAGFVPLEVRIDCARLLAPFMRPKLAAHEFVSDSEDSSRSKDAERARLLAQDPEVRRLLETIAEKHGQLPDKEEVIQ